MRPDPRLLFGVRLATLLAAISGCVIATGWAAHRLMRTESDALVWAGELADRLAEGRAEAETRHARVVDQVLDQVATASRARGGEDLDLRMDNLIRIHRMYLARRDAAGAGRLPGTITPLTVWTNPVTGKTLPLNATKDGRLDPVAVAAIRASIEPKTILALARERAAQEAPLTPAERVQQDLARLR